MHPCGEKNEKEQRKKDFVPEFILKKPVVSVSICLLEALSQTDVLFNPRLLIYFFSLYYSSDPVYAKRRYCLHSRLPFAFPRWENCSL